MLEFMLRFYSEGIQRRDHKKVISEQDPRLKNEKVKGRNLSETNA